MRTLPSDLLLPRGSRGEQGTGIVTTAVKRSITEDKNELHDGKSILISQQTPRRRLHILKRKKKSPLLDTGVAGGCSWSRWWLELQPHVLGDFVISCPRVSLHDCQQSSDEQDAHC